MTTLKLELCVKEVERACLIVVGSNFAAGAVAFAARVKDQQAVVDTLPRLLPQRRDDASDGFKRTVDDKLMANTHNAITRTLDAALALCIKPHSLLMIAAIDLNDELDGVGTEVNDVLANDDLATKANPEPTALEVTPEHGFRVGGVVAHEASALLERELA